MEYRKVAPGTPANQSPARQAAWLNNVSDVSKWYNETIRFGEASTGKGLGNPTDLVKVKNLTGGNLLRGSVVQLGDYRLDPINFRNLWFEGNEIETPLNFAVMREATKENDQGWAQMDGVCTALVSVLSTSHKYAHPVPGESVCRSATSGPLVILSNLTETGGQEVAVRFATGTVTVALLSSVSAATGLAGSRVPATGSSPVYYPSATAGQWTYDATKTFPWEWWSSEAVTVTAGSVRISHVIDGKLFPLCSEVSIT